MADGGAGDRLIEPAPIRIGLSACLLGERVRYDGGHKRDAWISGVLARHVELVALCPEVGIGLDVPRPPVRLVGDPGRPRAVGVDDPRLDVTARLAAFARGAAPEDLSGYIFKSGSPSCGLRGVPVYGPRGGVRRASGIHAGALLRRCPLLPVAEERDLGDPARRAHFLERVFAYRRWRAFTAAPVSAAALARFHARHELALMAHGAAPGRIIAHLAASEARTRTAAYGRAFMAAYARPTTRPRHTRVLRHIAGRLRPALERAERAQLQAAIEAYRVGAAARTLPLRLVRRHLRRHPDPYLTAQIYLEPGPRWVHAEGQ